MNVSILIRDNEEIRISEYGFEYYRNGDFKNAGLVDDLDYTINCLIEDGWQRVR